MENYIVLTHNYLSQALVFPPQWGTSIQWYMTITTECMKLKLNECLSLQTSLQMMFYVTSDIFMLWKTKFFVWLWLKITSNFKGQYEGLPQNDPAGDVMVVCSEYAVYQVKLFFHYCRRRTWKSFVRGSPRANFKLLRTFRVSQPMDSEERWAVHLCLPSLY